MSETDGRHPWKRSAFEVREAVAELVSSIPHGYPSGAMLAASDTHDQLHRWLMEYRQILQPMYQSASIPDSVDDPWQEELATVQIPDRQHEVRLTGQQRLRSDMSDWDVINAVQSQLTTQAYDVTLENLPDLFDARTVTVTVRAWTQNEGEVSRTVKRSLCIPVSVAKRARGKLDYCLSKFGWLPEADGFGDDEAHALAADIIEPNYEPGEIQPEIAND